MTAFSKLKKNDITYGKAGKKRKNPTIKREAHDDAAILAGKVHATLQGQVDSFKRWVDRYKMDYQKKVSKTKNKKD